MTDEKDLTPRLGRIGSQTPLRQITQLKRLARAARKGQPRSHNGGRLQAGAIRFQGRGKAAAALARHWSHARQRRVVVKVHIARAGSAGNAAFARHLSYVHREGTDREGHRGTLYDRYGEVSDATEFNERARDDRRQFRLIVSPEDSTQMKDITAFTRALMEQAEKDLGRRLDWVAVNHHDTAHPHVHIVIRGGSPRNGELIIDRNYITHGFRHRAEAEVTREFGQRRLREIAASRSRETEREAFTSIDREILRVSAEGGIELNPETSVLDRFDRAVKARRLRHLERLGLARHEGRSQWGLKDGWDDTLRALGRRGDLVNAMARAMGERLNLESLREFSPNRSVGSEITGRLAAVLPGDELRNGRLLLIEGIDGHPWTAHITEAQTVELPKIGGVISLTVDKPERKAADKVIAEIAARNGGVYSDALHTSADPTSSPAYRLAHKRRLEALRRLRIVERQSDGSWQIPPDFEQRALEAQSRRAQIKLTVLSWLPVEQLTERHAHTWLDRTDENVISDFGSGFGAEVRAARFARQLWAESTGLDLRTETQLKASELSDFIANEASRTGKEPVELASREAFKGVYARHVDLAQGRFAVIESEGRFMLAGWSARNAAWKGREITLSQRGRSIQWQLMQERNLGL